jgi:hypothetical protein
MRRSNAIKSARRRICAETPCADFGNATFSGSAEFTTQNFACRPRLTQKSIQPSRVTFQIGGTLTESFDGGIRLEQQPGIMSRPRK